MDWGIDPARVAEIGQIASSRRFSARDTEKFVLAITGGGAENADMPLWDMLQVLFALGALTAKAEMAARDAAIACMLDETGIFLRPLRGPSISVGLAGATVEASAAEVVLNIAGKTRTFSWSRVRRGLGLADFLFAAEAADSRGESGLVALRDALDLVFTASTFDEACLKRAVQGPARFMRAWRRRNLPLMAFADLIRQREAFLHAHGRRDRGRDLDPDGLMALWTFALENGETWSFSRFTERFCALLREERAGVGRRDMLAPVTLDALVGRQPSEDPEDALIAWLDRDEHWDDDAADPGEDEEGQDEPDDEAYDGLRERSALALMRLPNDPKFVNKEERETAARALALLPLAHEQPLTLARARAVAPWENRLVEATRRSVGSTRGQVDSGAETFDYPQIAAELAALARRFDELLLIGIALGAIKGPRTTPLAAEGLRILKRWRHDRASFKIDDAKLALIFARQEQGLRTVAGALHRVVRQQMRMAEQTDLAAQAKQDFTRFGDVFSERYLGRVKRQ